MSTSKKKATTTAPTGESVKKTRKDGAKGFMFGILGIGMALVIVSIAYSTSVIYLGTNGLTPKIMLAPQVTFGVVVLGYAFSRIFNNK